MKRKLIAFLTSATLLIFMAAGLWVPSYHVLAADDDAEEEETTDTGNDLSEDALANDSIKDDGTEIDVPLGQLIAYWTFDDNYNETASGMTTKLGGKKLTYTQGVFGKAAVFNGKDTYLTVKDALLNLGNSREDNNDNFTISAWVNLGDCKSGENYLLDKGKHIGWGYDDDCNWTNPYAVLFNGNEPMVYLSDEFEQTDKIVTEGNGNAGEKYVEGNEWFLLTVTYDGNCIKIYHDNQLLSQSNYTKGITFNKDELFIGCDGYLENFFKGAVDDLRIYTKTLSYDEVSDLYDQGVKSNQEFVEPVKKVVAYYPFDNNLKDASDYKNDAEKVSATGKIKYVTGMNGKAITMSRGSYIRIPAADQLNLEDEFTISFWLKNSLEGDFPILYRQNPSFRDNNDNDWTYSLNLSSWNKGLEGSVSFFDYLYNPDSWSPDQGPGLTADFSYGDDKIKNTSWNHYTFTYKDGQTKCYINGVMRNKSEESDLVNIANASGDLLVGFDGDKFFTGAIDELIISTKCSSADDIEKEAQRFDSISLSSSDISDISSINKGKTVALASIQLKDGDTGEISRVDVNDENITYKSSNKSVMTVSADGKLTGVKAGKSMLTVSYGPHTITYKVIVK